MFTANEARKLSGPTITERVEEVCLLIKETAEKKKREVRLHESFWVHGGYSGTAEYKDAKKMLEELGYTVEFYYTELSIAVDMYTIVRW